MVEAILWDNDGVLVDTEGLFYQATRLALARAEVDLTPELYLDYAMRRGRSTLELVAAQGWSPEQVDALRDARNVMYSNLLRTESSIFPNVLPVLQSFSQRIRMAVVTSSRREHVEIAHQRNGLLGFFEFILAWEDYQYSKPHPEPYLMALRRLGLSADRCVVIEDSERGLASALAAGLRCFVVPNQLTQDCVFQGATAIVPNLAALPELVAGL
ncbi:MAG TPA: HAD family phosphatase [Candidatus Angelobacter sp.]|nr:HAD family phosphatase [Candidatus Angelobacter sp.]